MRKDPLVNKNCYHIISRSIAQYQVFKEDSDCSRFMQIVELYRYLDFLYKYSNFLSLTKNIRNVVINSIKKDNRKSVEIIAYCIMPTHLHLILKQITDNGISQFMSKILNSYTRYYNVRYHRKGPLWEGRFKSIIVKVDEQLLHLTRYIHLNPVSAGLVERPEDWIFSSYKEYINEETNLCDFREIIDIQNNHYQHFVKSRIPYQKELSIIKRCLIENYSG